MVSCTTPWLDGARAGLPPPDKRYRQALADAAQNRFRLPGHAHSALRGVTECLQRLDSAANESQRRAVFHLPHCRQFRVPLELFGNREEACRLEALVLAGQDNFKIAGKLNLAVNTVSLYQEIFFDVRGHHRNHDYIVRGAILPEASAGAPETARRRVALKTVAYLCGPRALEDLFFLGTRRPVEVWEHPAIAVRRLAAGCDLECIADLVMGSAGPLDPKAHRASIEQLCSVLEALYENYPTNELDWAKRNMEPLVHLS